MPLKSIRLMTAVRSLPRTVRVEFELCGPGATVVSSATPSIRTLLEPLSVATITTRRIGGIAPPARRKIVCSGDWLLSVKASSKPLMLVPDVVTVTLVSASSTISGSGTGTAGPTISVRLMPLSTWHPGNALRQRDAQLPTHGLDQLVRAQRPVGVAEPPVLLRIAQIFGREIVQAIALRHDNHSGLREAFGRRHEAALDVNHRRAGGTRERRRPDREVAAVRREQARLQPDLLHQALQGGVRIDHQMPPMPSMLSAPGT